MTFDPYPVNIFISTTSDFLPTDTPKRNCEKDRQFYIVSRCVTITQLPEITDLTSK